MDTEREREQIQMDTERERTDPDGHRARENGSRWTQSEREQIQMDKAGVNRRGYRLSHRSTTVFISLPLTFSFSFLFNFIILIVSESHDCFNNPSLFLIMPKL